MSPPGKYDPGGARTTVYLNMSLVCSVRTLEGAGSDSRSHMIHLQAGNRFRTVKDDQVTHLGFGLSHFPGSSAGKESICSARDPGLIPGSGRSLEKG